MPCPVNTRYVQPGQRDSIHVQEIGGQDPGGLSVEELPPGRAVPSRRRVDARGAQDLVDRGRRDRNAELGQLAVNTTVIPERVLVRQADGEPAMLRTVAGGRVGAACWCRVFWQRACGLRPAVSRASRGRSRPSAGAG